MLGLPAGKTSRPKLLSVSEGAAKQSHPLLDGVPLRPMARYLAPRNDVVGDCHYERSDAVSVSRWIRPADKTSRLAQNDRINQGVLEGRSPSCINPSPSP